MKPHELKYKTFSYYQFFYKKVMHPIEIGILLNLAVVSFSNEQQLLWDCNFFEAGNVVNGQRRAEGSLMLELELNAIMHALYTHLDGRWKKQILMTVTDSQNQPTTPNTPNTVGHVRGLVVPFSQWINLIVGSLVLQNKNKNTVGHCNYERPQQYWISHKYCGKSHSNGWQIIQYGWNIVQLDEILFNWMNIPIAI
jgi:hypothetical protein